MKRPKLFVNTLEVVDTSPQELKDFASQVFTETDKYSITPKAFESRDFEQVGSGWYKDKYECSGIVVLRYGIDQKSLELLNLNYHIKANSVSVSAQVHTQAIGKVQRHALEEQSFQYAIDYLFLDNQTRTVLVDVLERDISDGAITVDSSGKAAIHTVLLYKQPQGQNGKHEVLVIDPSNSWYSDHLSKINCINPKLEKITCSEKKVNIYTPPSQDKVGSDLAQYRDCIDISVKLAALLSGSKSWESISADGLVKNRFVQLVSNNDVVDKGFKKFADLSVKVKQSSDIQEMCRFNMAQDWINKNFEILKDLKGKVMDKCKLPQQALDKLIKEIDSRYNNIYAEYEKVLQSSASVDYSKVNAGLQHVNKLLITEGIDFVLSGEQDYLKSGNYDY